MTDIELKLNAWDSNPGITVFCVQGEQKARTLHITLIDRTGVQDVMSVAPVTPRYIDLTGYTPRMYVSKPDNTGVYFPGTVSDAENGKVDFTLTGQCVAVPGKADCTISLIKDDVELKIVGIVLDIRKSDTDDFVEASADEFVELEVLTSQAKEAAAECVAAVERAEQAVEAANEVVQADHTIVEDAKTQAASAKAAAESATSAANAANNAASVAQTAADRANSAAENIENTDLGNLTINLNNHLIDTVVDENGSHGLRIFGGDIECFTGSNWQKAMSLTIRNPVDLPEQYELSTMTEPGVYYGVAPSDFKVPYILAPYTLFVVNGGQEMLSRMVIVPYDGTMFAYSESDSMWIQMAKAPIDEGSKGIWTYRKYADGTAECWGITTKTISCTSPFGNWFYNSGGYTYETYPFEFAEPPVCNYSINSSGSGSVSVVPMTRGVESTTTTSTQIMVTRPTAVSDISVEVHWNVKGRWK